MIVALSGSRSLADQPEQVWAGFLDGMRLLGGLYGAPTLYLHGDAPGVDRILAERLAAHGKPVEAMPADWEGEGKAAGFNRNQRMVDRADAVCAVWNGQSNGTRDALKRARNGGKAAVVTTIGGE